MSNPTVPNTEDVRAALRRASGSAYYVLNADHSVSESDDVIEWAKGFEITHRIVGKDKVGDVEVSTVFLGIDHGWHDGPPLLFETMIFGGEWDSWQWRDSTYAQAEARHARVLAALIAGESPDSDAVSS